MDKNIKYLVNNNGEDKEMLEQGQYKFRDHSPHEISAEISLSNPPRNVRVNRKDLVIDLPPRTESLTFNAAVLIPVKRSRDSRKDKCESNGGKSEQKYVSGAVDKAQDSEVVTVKTHYKSKRTIAFPLFPRDWSMCSIGQDALLPQYPYPPRGIKSTGELSGRLKCRGVTP